MRLLALGTVALLPALLAAQTPATPTYEVASIKLVNPHPDGGPRRSSEVTPSGVAVLPGGRFESYGQTLRNLIAWVYDINTTFQRIKGRQDVLQQEFAITGKATSSTLTRDEAKAIVRTLLAERFQLQLRRQPRQVDGYELVPAREDRRPGPALRSFTDDCEVRAQNLVVRFDDPQYEAKARCAWNGIGGRQRGIGQTLGDIAVRLTGLMATPVVDRTGWTGRYTFDVTGSTDAMPVMGILPRPPGMPPRPLTSDEPQLLEVFRNELGLRLMKTRATIDDLIIVRAEPLIEN